MQYTMGKRVEGWLKLDEGVELGSSEPIEELRPTDADEGLPCCNEAYFRAAFHACVNKVLGNAVIP